MAKLPVLELIPHHGFGPIRFGMPRPEVRTAMRAIGIPRSHGDDDGTLDYFGDENAIQVEYIDGTASFIGVSNGGEFLCVIHGIDPFDMPAQDLFTVLAKRAEHGEAYDANEVVFRSTIVTLYEADEQYDRKGGESRPVWSQIGVGDARYLAAVDEINGG